MSDNLEKSAEKHMIPLVFQGVSGLGSIKYTRLDKKSLLSGEVEVLPGQVRVMYNGRGKVRADAGTVGDGLIFPETPVVGEEREYFCSPCNVVLKEEDSGMRPSYE